MNHVEIEINVFEYLGVRPNEPFRITGQPSNVEFRITDNLNVEYREEGYNNWGWVPSRLELQWFLLGKYNNGVKLKIIKPSPKKMTLNDIEKILGYKIELVNE